MYTVRPPAAASGMSTHSAGSCVPAPDARHPVVRPQQPCHNIRLSPRATVLPRPLQRLQAPAPDGKCTGIGPPSPAWKAPQATALLGPRQLLDGSAQLLEAAPHRHSFGNRGSPEASTAASHGRPNRASMVRAAGSSRCLAAPPRETGGATPGAAGRAAATGGPGW
jgi:hypothetical protein